MFGTVTQSRCRCNRADQGSWVSSVLGGLVLCWKSPEGTPQSSPARKRWEDCSCGLQQTLPIGHGSLHSNARGPYPHVVFVGKLVAECFPRTFRAGRSAFPDERSAFPRLTFPEELPADSKDSRAIDSLNPDEDSARSILALRNLVEQRFRLPRRRPLGGEPHETSSISALRRRQTAHRTGRRPRNHCRNYAHRCYRDQRWNECGKPGIWNFANCLHHAVGWSYKPDVLGSEAGREGHVLHVGYSASGNPPRLSMTRETRYHRARVRASRCYEAGS